MAQMQSAGEGPTIGLGEDETALSWRTFVQQDAEEGRLGKSFEV
jgi:hypothetical protein